MNICLFGGTFDPIHRGHLTVARAAADRFHLKRVLMAPAFISPFKQKDATDFLHRYAMVAIAAAEGDDARLEASPIEFDLNAEHRDAKRPSYTLDTVRALKKQLKKSDKLFFLLGMDAFASIAKWHQAEELLREVDFIVASRPGYKLGDIADALPAALRPSVAIVKAVHGMNFEQPIVHAGMTLHLLPDLSERVSATQIRKAAGASSAARLRKLVPNGVAAYIQQLHLYNQ